MLRGELCAEKSLVSEFSRLPCEIGRLQVNASAPGQRLNSNLVFSGEESIMKIPVLIIASAALFGSAVGSVSAAPSDYLPSNDKSAADNSAQNARDRDSQAMTPIDQSNKPEDVDLTRRVRQAVESDSNLSVDAKNVKIITVDGVVWLRGPVKSAEEKAEIARAAHNIAGADRVHDEIQVARETHND
jgi:hyperosmotically inducible protein